MSNGTRAAHRAAHRADHRADHRSGTRSATRLTKGALVAVLAGALTVTAAAARENSPLHQLVASADEGATGVGSADRAAATQASRAQRARAAMVDVAADAIVVADTVGTEGKSTKVDSARLKKLDKAAAKLKTLMTKVGTAAPATTAGGDSDEVSATATKEGASDAPSSSATAGTGGTGSSEAAASDGAASADSSSTDTAKAAPTTGTTPSADTAPSGTTTPDTTTSDTTTSDTAASAPADGTDASQDVAADSPLTSLAESPDMPAPSTSGTTSSTTSDDAAPTAADAASSADDLVVPAITGAEDSQTLALRTALQEVVDLSSDVEADAAKMKAAAQKKAAAEKAAAKKAAQMAAWKKSLLGYPNGQIPASALCTLSFDSGARLRCDAAQDLEKLNTAYRKAFGRSFTITDSYRSLAGQVACRATKGSLCATPGTSNHGTGIAVDFGGGIQTSGTSQYRWMVAHAATYDWAHPSWATSTKFEPWHWEYTG